MDEVLLNRETFRHQVFVRDAHRCVVCGVINSPDMATHHIMERRLFPDGGYYLSNGALLCAEHHLKAETTELSTEEVRKAAGISSVILPPHLYRDSVYDKWGNIINEDGTRTPGELFEDLSVQKILAKGNKLVLFTAYRKYPRTYHLPWSPCITKDDRVLTHAELEEFVSMPLVVTEKMDGENTTIYSDGYCHARSLDMKGHPSRSRVKGLAAQLTYQIPQGWRVCGENLFATHSIAYRDLADYFLVFSIWDQNNNCLSWGDTLEWTELLGLKTVPVLGCFTIEDIQEENFTEYAERSREGYVVRKAASFHYSAFRRSLAKYVATRSTTEHNWLAKKVEYNSLREVS